MTYYLQLLTVFNFIDENDQLKVMCEHRDLLLYNSLQLLTVFNFIDENDNLKYRDLLLHRDLLLYNSLQLLTVFFNFIDENDQLKVMCEHRDLLTTVYSYLLFLTL